MGTEGMSYSLQSRDLIADSIETVMGGQWYDALITLPGCDKNMPGCVMAMGRVNRPSIMVYGGTIRAGFAFPWAGAMFFPADAPMQPVDLSAAKELVFHVRGEGGALRVMAFAASLGQVPAQRSYPLTAEWREIAVPFSAFGIDGGDLAAIVWSGGPEPGEFRFRIDGVGFR